MLIVIIAVFVLGYFAIAMEHTFKVNKAGTALFMAVLLWTLYIMGSPLLVPQVHPEAFRLYLESNPSFADLSLLQQCLNFIVNIQIIESLGEISETLFFLIGAMTIVELIDEHGGFAFITNRITTKEKKTLLWLISFITFFMSAILDNMTTSIVMVMLVLRIIPNYKERWVFSGMIIIAANSGGAWSPIGDVTTIMLWIKGNVTSMALVKNLLIPSLVSMVVPAFFASRLLHGIIKANMATNNEGSFTIDKIMTRSERLSIFILGVACLIAVPIFKSITGLPPFMGIIMGLGFMWIYTDIMYGRMVSVNEKLKHRVTHILSRIDTPTILFFLGILMAVAVLQVTGILGTLATYLNNEVHNIYIINILIGLLSSIVDNVPLVAAAIGMYPLADSASIAASADPAFLQYFVQDGLFWHFLAYCAGVGGSVLIIGSVAGVVIMGIEKIPFGWYLKNISGMAFMGYLAGAAAFILQTLLINGTL